MSFLYNVTETPEQAEQRLQTLDALADGLASQGSYHLAAMKYTLAGNKIKVKICNGNIIIVTTPCRE